MSSVEPVSVSELAMENTRVHWRAWLVCFTASLFFFYEFIQGHMFNSIAPDVMRAFDIGVVQLAWLSSIYYIANVVFLFPAGIILDRYSTKKLILTAMALSVMGTAMIGWVDQIWLVYVGRFLTGIGSAFCFLSAIRLASRWFPAHRMALVTGLIVTVAMTGGMVAQTPLTLLVKAFDWRTALLFNASLGLFIILMIALYVRDYPSQQTSLHQQHHDHLQEVGFWRGLRRSYLNLQNISAALYTSLMNMPFAIIGAMAGSLFLVQVHGFTRVEASYVINALFLGVIIGGPTIGWFSDRIRRRRQPMIWGALSSLAVILSMIYAANFSLTQWFLLFFALGLLTSTQVLSYPTVAESNHPALTATSVSVVSILTQGGIALYQLMFGYLLKLGWDGQYVEQVPLHSVSDYHFALTMIPLGFIIALSMVFFLRETYCQKQ